MPEKLEKCVSDVKAQGKSDDSAWAICVDSTGEKPHKEADTTLPLFKKNVQEKVNANRQVPFFNPPNKVDSNKPDNRKTTKGIGGPRINTDSFLWKDIFDAQLRRNVKEPRI